MANERYKVVFHEWVSTKDPERPLQRKLVIQTEHFKTKKEAVEFRDLFKDDKSISNLFIFDTASGKQII